METYLVRRPVYGGVRNSHQRKGYGDAPRASARQGWADAPAADVKVMEMQVGPRPVYGGPGRMKLKKPAA